jgi:hypothetical protein
MDVSLRLVLILVAVVLFAVAAAGVATGRVNLIAAGLAFLAAGQLAS